MGARALVELLPAGEPPIGVATGTKRGCRGRLWLAAQLAACANYRERDAALATAFSEAVTIFSSMPTPQRVTS